MTDPDPAPIHRGHDLETGILARARQWTDVFGWIRMARVLRVAGSPPLLFLTGVAMTLDRIGEAIFGSRGFPLETAWAPALIGRVLEGVIEDLVRLSPATLFVSSSDQGILATIAMAFWSSVVWAPVALVLLRQGALLTAGRSMLGFAYCLTWSLRRTPAALLAAWMPVICAALMAAPLLLAGWLSGLTEGSPVLSWLLGSLSLLIAIPAGLLAAGATVAVPLAWAAIANESEPDALDSLSRGYEYLFRRPLQLSGYVAASLIMIIVVTLLGSAASNMSLAITEDVFTMLQVSDGRLADILPAANEMAVALPQLMAFALTWSLIAACYLLLRRDAGGQEVEDLWQTPIDTPARLPKLDP